MTTRTKVRGDGSVDQEIMRLQEDIYKVLSSVENLTGSNKTRTLRNMSAQCGFGITTAIVNLGSAMADLQMIACRAIIRSQKQRTSIGGSPTRRKKSDGSIGT